MSAENPPSNINAESPWLSLIICGREVDGASDSDQIKAAGKISKDKNPASNQVVVTFEQKPADATLHQP